MFIILFLLSHLWTLAAEDPSTRVTEHRGTITLVSPGGATLWYNEPLQGNVSIEYDARVIPDRRFRDDQGYRRASDLNVFWMANDTCPEGGSGKFTNNYALELYYVGMGGNGNTTTRFRRYTGDGRGVENPAFRPPVLQEFTDKQHLLEPRRWYHVRVEMRDGHALYFVDGQCWVDFLDPTPLTSGFFGFRTTLSKTQIRNFRITQN